MSIILVLGFFTLAQGKLNSRYIHLSQHTWKSYKAEYNLKFEREEDARRSSVYHTNVQYINNFNAANRRLRLAINKFAHLTNEEFSKLYLSSSIKENPRYKRGSKLELEVDWRTKGVVNPVKTQKDCQASYAFSAIGSLESMYAIKKKELLALSEQELVDCSITYGNLGCLGGIMEFAFQYIQDKGISNSTDYPYVAEVQTCRSTTKSPVIVTGLHKLEKGSENALSDAIVSKGPVSVYIDASQPSFQFYHSGIYYDSDCRSDKVNHALVAVGVYQNYYIVRNSLGPEWGENGYIRMSRNRDNNCGIATLASYPIV